MQDTLILGPQPEGHHIRINIWAPNLNHCEIWIKTTEDGADREWTATMEDHGNGRFSYLIHSLAAEIFYALQLPSGERIPDPYSPENDGGVHGVSKISRDTFNKIDTSIWRGTLREELIITELHVGAFTKEGTFNACCNRLKYLADLGITAIQLMPIFLTPGDRNWGYDPVSFFTVNPNYGSLKDLKDLVDHAHSLDMSVILDCVFNHLGPEGNYFPKLTSEIFSKDESTPWGDKINLEDDQIQSIIFSSIKYWMHTVGVDGIRVDAAEYLRPGGSIDFLLSLARETRRNCRHKRAILILEHDHYKLSKADLDALFGIGAYDLLWNSSISHAFEVKSSHYENLRNALCVIAGDSKLSSSQHTCSASNYLLNFLRSHDTIGNAGENSRNEQYDFGLLFDVLPLLFLSPTTPMLFMGDDWLSESPFHFFCDLYDVEESKLVAGRRLEFPNANQNGPSPMSSEAFTSSKIDWAALSETKHRDVLNTLHQLIQIRKEFTASFIRAGFKLESFKSIPQEKRSTVTWRSNDNDSLTVCLQPRTALSLPPATDEQTIFSNHTCITHTGDISTIVKLKYSKPNSAHAFIPDLAYENVDV